MLRDSIRPQVVASGRPELTGKEKTESDQAFIAAPVGIGFAARRLSTLAQLAPARTDSHPSGSIFFCPKETSGTLAGIRTPNLLIRIQC